MRPSAQQLRAVYLLPVFWLVLSFFLPSLVLAQADTDQCPVNSTCTVGEFLFNDSYTPITGATCTINSKDPSGNTYINNAAMTGAADGFYSYSVNTTGATTGYYRTTVCCTSGTDYLCIDKSFNVIDASSGSSLTASDVENAVWNAQLSSHNTSSTFGNFVQAITGGGGSSSSVSATDVWNHGTRSLTSFGDLIAGIWSYPTRSIPASGLPRSTSGGAARLPVQQPIIDTTVIETEDLGVKLDRTQQTIALLEEESTTLLGGYQSLSSSWTQSPAQSLTDTLASIREVLGAANTKSSIAGSVSQLKSDWDNPLIKDLEKLANELTSNTDDLSSRLNFYGKPSTKQPVNYLITKTASLRELIGQPDDSTGKTTLYGHLKYLRFLADSLSANKQELETLMTGWSKLSYAQRNQKLSSLKTQIGDLNQIPGSKVLGATTNKEPSITQKNEALYLQALVAANQRLLAQKPNQALQNYWLEEGSVIFKTLISNPNTSGSLEVPLKYYLPKEIREDDILKVDEGLDIRYDHEKDAFYVGGTFTLAAGESRTFSVETQDVWALDTEEITRLRQQAADLLEPLKNTAYFGQAAALKADIDVALDRAQNTYESSNTPETRIKGYRDAQIEINGAKQKIEAMETLISSASGAGSIFGFVGGVQAIAVWGLIIILATGFVFLALYMRTLRLAPIKTTPKPPRQKSTAIKLSQLFLLITTAASITSLSGGSVLAFRTRPENATAQNASKTALQSPLAGMIPKSRLPNPPEVAGPTPPVVLGEQTPLKPAILLVKGGVVTVFQNSDLDSPPVATFSANQPVSVRGEIGDWSEIEFLKDDSLTTGWVKSNSLKVE